ncbi:MAG: hypothetical protein AAF515_14490 [Pseudomonadota bacterium]
MSLRPLILLTLCLWARVASAAPGDVLFTDDFERAALAPWGAAGTGIAGVSAATANSPTNSLFTAELAVAVTSPTIDLTVPGATLSLWIRRGDDAFSEDPDAGENLVVGYLDAGGVERVLTTQFGSGTPGEIAELTFQLPSAALHSNFQVVLRQSAGSGGGFDFWHVDDVAVVETGASVGGGGMSVGECDDFDGGLDNFTVTSGGGTAGTSAATFQSASLSGFLQGGVVSLATLPTNTIFGFSGISLYVRRGADSFSENPDAGEDLVLSYLDDTGTPVVLQTFAGNGTPGEIFTPSFDLSATAAAQHESFQFEIRTAGGNAGAFDFWHVDDVCLLGTLTPDLALSSSLAVEDDPITGLANPKAIPQADLIMTVLAVNQGPAVFDSNSLVLRLDVPAEKTMFVDDFDGAGSPIRFTDGAVASGLSMTFGGLADLGDSVTFLDATDTPIVPTPTDGYDEQVAAVLVQLDGSLASATLALQPSFQLEYRLRLD